MLKDGQKEYLVQVTVIEGRYFAAKDSNGMSNPFIKIKCAKLDVQSTDVIYESLNPAWNQNFTFQGLMLSENEIQTSELEFAAYSKNRFFGNDLIGKFAINLSTLYKNKNHEYFNAWLVLVNEQSPNDPQGYLLINAFIIGPGDRPPVHDANENVNQDVADEDEETDISSMNIEQLKAYQEKKQGVIVLGKPTVARKAFQLSVYIFKCENIVSFDSAFGPTKPNVFISARVSGLVQITKPVKNNNPVYNQKLRFPCHFPFLNDKIILRMWNKQSGSGDIFIANIPEFQKHNDFFNISKLISLGGKLPAKWINLYSIPPHERNPDVSLSKKIKHPKEGTYFMGRILLSISLIASENPKFQLAQTQPFIDPDTQTYALFCDIYELKDLNDKTFDILVWCDCRIGTYTTGDNRAKKPINNERVYWVNEEKSKEINLNQIVENFPKDITQVPDIFINLYTRCTGKAQRIGYIRLKAEDVIKWEPTPRWLHFKPLDMDNDSPGSVLLNLQFSIKSENTKRVFKQKGISQKYVLYSYIISGFELDPKDDNENLETEININLDKENIKTEKIGIGKYPFWNEIRQFKVELDWKLDFTPDVVVTVFKLVKQIFGSEKARVEIGKFTIPVRTIKAKKKKYPQYFNIIKNNQAVGRILAMFYIVEEKKKSKESIEAIFPLYNSLKVKRIADVKIFILGLRNLDFEIDLNKVELEIFLCQQDKQIPQGTSKESLELEKINPSPNDNLDKNLINIVRIFELKNVIIYGNSEFQIYPYIKILIRQKHFFYTQERYIMFNLSEFCSEVSEHTKKIYRLIFQQNLGITSLDQEQSPIEGEILIETATENKFTDETNEDEVKLIPAKEQTNKNKNLDYDDEKYVTMITKYKNMVVSENIELECMHKDKLEEKEAKKLLRKKIVKELRDLMKMTPYTKEQNEIMIDLQNKLSDLKKPQMTEPMFFGFDDIADEYDYGREVFKEDIYEFHPDMKIEHKKRNLSYIPTGLFTEKHEVVEGYMKLGKETDNFIKFNVQLKYKDGNETTLSNEEEITQAIAKLESKSLAGSDKKKKSEEEEKLEDYKLEEELKKEVMKYDIFNHDYVNIMREIYLMNKDQGGGISRSSKNKLLPLNSLKVRVYVYRCLNLTAQDDNCGIIDKMAGYSAFSRANAYLELAVGKGENVENRGLKFINDSVSYVADTLSPNFYKYYELEADLPQDWLLTINVKSFKEGSIVHNLIGSTTIDLEDRYLGDSRNRNILKLKSLYIHYSEVLKRIEKSDDEEKDQKLDKILDKLSKINARIDQLKVVPIPVEYRPLLKPGKKTAQGIIEMLVEIFPITIAKIMKPLKIEPPPPEEYELRLVIWETFNLAYGKKVRKNIFTKF